MHFNRLLPAAIITLVVASGLSEARADAAGTFATMGGSWAGSGQMRLESGRTENLRCRANYSARKDGQGLGIALRCASASSKVDLRANLTASGNRISGNWEEREFNTGGNASGSASGNQISLSINGGIDGSMSVTTNGGRQSVSITTDNVALKGIKMSLSRE